MCSKYDHSYRMYKKSAQLGCIEATKNVYKAEEWFKKAAALGANGNEQSHTSKRRKTEATTGGTSDPDDDL